MAKTIGILTGGGDVPGLNTVIQEITLQAIDKGYNVVGIKRGWGGLVFRDPNSSDIDLENTIVLTEGNVRKIDREGGTMLHTSRINPSNVKSDKNFQKYRGFSFEGKKDLTNDVLENLHKISIDVLVTIGGDDTLSYSRQLKDMGIKIIGIPKTMDGDVYGAGYCLGFSTAITRSTGLITDLRTPCGSHERVGVIEQFGRNSGLTALYSAIAAKPNRVLIPEVPFDIKNLIKLVKEDYEKNPSRYALILIAEGAMPIGSSEVSEGNEKDAYGRVKLGGIGRYVGAELKKENFEIIENPLTYVIRAGAPDAKDKIMATIYANLAIDTIVNGDSGVLTAKKDGKVGLVPLEITAKSPLKVDIEKLYDKENYRPLNKGFTNYGLLL